MSNNMEPSTGSSSTEMKKCFTLLEEGEKIIRADQKNALLVVGNTGSGKTTLVQFLAGNNTELYAEETSPGEFIIVDKKDKISTATVVSKTIFPDLTIDEESSLGIYDCPGFVDTRGAAMDIAGTYFIRKVINSIDQIKIILTVNYPSVRKGVDRGDFLELVRHVLSLVKNVDKYCDSFAIIVTKVDNTYVKNKQTRNPELVSDNTIRLAVAKFLETFRENIPTISDKVFSARAIKLVNALLSKNGTSYERIGIFRRPDEAGPLSQISSLQDGKRFMKKMIENSIRFAHVQPNDFGYSISDRSKNEVNDLIVEIHQVIKTHILEICAKMEAKVNNKNQHVKDIRDFETFLTDVQKKIDLFQESILYETNLKDFVRKLLNLIVDLRVNVSKSNLSEIMKQGKYLDFLELVSERKVEGSSFKWKEGFRQITNKLNELKEWYSFLNQFYNRLSSYEVQKYKSKFAYLYQSEISSLSDDQMKQFFQSQKNFNITSSLEAMKLDTTQILTVNNLIRSALNTSTTIEYDPTLKGHIINGDYIILSEIDENLFNKDEVISIFASNTIFIDKNITSINQINNNLNNFAMIAPTLEVIGIERIVLDGKDGDSRPQLYQTDFLPGSDGRNGSPGHPGHPGTNFLGVAQNILNSESLMISANGGQGGPGQDGTDGVPGQNGRSPLEVQKDGSCAIRPLDLFSFQYKSGFIFLHYCSFGSRGKDGGNGGDGGIGGPGALPGSVTLTRLDGQKLLSSVSSKKGSGGRDGLGGKKGAGGQAGKSVNTRAFIFWWTPVDCDESDSLAREHGSCSNDDYLRSGLPGHDGEAGQITGRIRYPEPQKPAKNGAILMKYKEFMRHRLILDNLNQHEKFQFLTTLSRNSDLTETYTVEDLVSEFLDLENGYLNLLDFDWLALYEQLLKLVESHLKTSDSETNQVLLTLQKAIIGKLCFLKAQPQKTLITEVPQYLASEPTNLNHFFKEDESSLILNDNYEKLKEELNKSLKVVQQRAQPIIDKVTSMTDIIGKQIKNLVDELVNEDIKIQEKQQELLKNLISTKILNGIQETAQFLNVMGTFGAEMMSTSRLPNKYVIQENSYKPAILKLQEILLQIFQTEANNLPEQFKQILAEATNHQEIPNETKNLLKRFTEITEGSKKMAEILELRKTRQELLGKLLNSDLKPGSLQKILQTIEVFLYTKDTTILTTANGTTTRQAEILGATLHFSTAYNHIYSYLEKLNSVIEQIIREISMHLVDEIIDTKRSPKQKHFNNIKLLLQQLQKSAKLPEDLYSIFDQLLTDMNIISTAYDSLPYFQEFERFLNIKRDTSRIQNPDLKNMIDTLENITESNLVLGQYNVILKNMEQIVFPFGDLYGNEFNISNNVKNITSIAMYKLQTLKSSIEKNGIYLDPDHTKLILEGEFTNNENGLGAFYIWKNQNHKKAIEDLLAGKGITLKSDIVDGLSKDAVKFSSIRIKFTCKNEIMQSELDQELNNFQVSLVHGEDSFYRCGNEFYRLTFNQQPLKHSYRRKRNGEPVVENLSHAGIKNGVPVLSPYTQWSIQLEGENFEKLARYKDYIDIELEGQGTWIQDGGSQCSSNLQMYYTLDDTVSEANAVEDDSIDLSEVQLKNQQKKLNVTSQLHRVARSVVENQNDFVLDSFDTTASILPSLENVIPKQIDSVNSQQRPVSFCGMAQTSLNNCLLLLDLLVRRLSKVKPKYFDQCSTSYLHGKICSVEIVRDFDRLVESLCDYPQQYDIDPVPLMELIAKDISYKNGRNIAEILLKSVQSNGSSIPPEFYDQLRNKMTQEYSSKSELWEP